MKANIGNFKGNTWYSALLKKWFGIRLKRKISVIIHPWDLTAMDQTLAFVILDMLKELKRLKQSAILVDLKDIPEDLVNNELRTMCDGSTNDRSHEWWPWILDEMIWAFHQKTRDYWQEDFFQYEKNPDPDQGGLVLIWEDVEGLQVHQDRMTNGFRLFGKYYERLWN